MDIISLNYTALRFKTAEKIKSYLALSEHNKLTIGIYKNGKCYIFGQKEENNLFYDIGSVTKTLTAHLILKLFKEGKLDINCTVDKYLPLKKGKYPTLYQLLTHTAGYHHLTPIEITLPSLIAYGYSRKNPYENCSVKTVIKALERRRFIKPKTKYGYSDFASAILAAVAENIEKTDFSTLFENFIKNDLNLNETFIELDRKKRNPPAAKGEKLLPFWVWHRNNPYIAGGGLVSNISDMLKYIAMQIESDKPYIISAHKVCEASKLKNDNHLMCIGWHTYEKSNQLWHVGGVGTFRSSLIINKKLKLGVAVLGNAKGKASANAHYIAKMLYSELKNKRIKLKEK
ncbi:MAG: beta-lactamase family protein [Clostridia bacterium]|nr:beta-lactamase family protein [Clostridia bacterium]